MPPRGGRSGVWNSPMGKMRGNSRIWNGPGVKMGGEMVGMTCPQEEVMGMEWSEGGTIREKIRIVEWPQSYDEG